MGVFIYPGRLYSLADRSRERHSRDMLAGAWVVGTLKRRAVSLLISAALRARVREASTNLTRCMPSWAWPSSQHHRLLPSWERRWS